MRPGLCALTICALCCAISNIAAAATPLVAVELAPQQTQHIRFPTPIRIGMPADSPLQAEVLEEHLWLSAPDLQGKRQRILVQTADPTKRWILEVSTPPLPRSAATTLPTLHIAPVPPDRLRPERLRSDRGEKEIHWHYVRLARWVFQQIYSPPRLLSPLPGVIRYPMKPTAVRLTRCVQTPRPACPLIQASLLAAWRYSHSTTGTIYATAVQLHNAERRRIQLAPELLRGHWLAISFSARQLGAADEATASAIALLLSARPPKQMLTL